MFENFNRFVVETKQMREEKQKEQERIKVEKTKPIPFWREEHSRTTSSGVML